MKRITLHLVFLTTVLMLAEVSAAQVATGTMPFNSYGGGPFDVVNLGNLNVHFAVPVFHKAGRGLPFNYDLSYDSSVWTPVVVNSVLTWQPAQNWGWTIPWTGTTGYVTYQVIGGNCGGPPPTGGWQSYVNWQYVDRSGAVHGFPGSWYFSGGSCGTNSNSSFTSPASDNSGLTLFAGSCSGGGICVQEANGKRYYPPVNPTNTTQVQTTQGDDNGNQITLNPTNGQITDTLGQVALTIAGTNPMTFAYTPPSGTPVNYGMTYGIFNVKTHFGCSVADTTINNVSLVTSISLPDGTSYSFTYETTQGFSTYKTGRLASVKLPTGGTITYS